MKILTPNRVAPYGLVLRRTLASATASGIAALFSRQSKEHRPSVYEIITEGILGVGINLLPITDGIITIHLYLIRICVNRTRENNN